MTTACFGIAGAIKYEVPITQNWPLLALTGCGIAVGIAGKLLYKRKLKLLDESVVMAADNPYRAEFATTLPDLTEKGFAAPRFYETAQPRPD